MKAPTLLCVFLLLFSLSNYSQEYQAGIRGGINEYSFAGITAHNGFLDDPPELHEAKQELGYQYGLYFRMELDKFLFWTEINYLKAEGSYGFRYKSSKWKTSKIELPILAGFKPFKPFTIYLGPMINFNGDSTVEGVQITSFSDGGPDFDKTTFSFNFGILIKSGRFGIDLRYEHALKESEEELLDIIRSTYGVNLADLEPNFPHVLSASLLIDIYRTNTKKEDGLLGRLFNKNKKCGCPY